MKLRVQLLCLLLSAVVLWALSSSGETPDRSLREANRAFERDDFAMAVALYTQAEEDAEDPGKVASNQAAALFRLGRVHEAREHYSRCLEQAPDERKYRIYYNLGTCLAHESLGSNVPLLREAMLNLEACIRGARDDAELLADARHNLAVVTELLRTARVKQPPDRHPDESRDLASHRPPREGVGASDLGNSAGPAEGEIPQADANGNPSDDGAIPTEVFTPGPGNLPPVLDDPAGREWTPEEAATYLRAQIQRINAERRASQRRTAPPPDPRMPDW